MQIKKNIIGLVLVSFVSLYAAQAQHEVHLNFLNIAFYEINAEYEYGFQTNKSISLMAGYVYGFPDADQVNKYFYIGPEYRAYFSKKKQASGFYLGFYMRYKTGYYPSGLYETGYLQSNPNIRSSTLNFGNMNYEKLVAGMSLGAKWVSPIGFTYGFFVAGGVNIRANYDFQGLHSNKDLFTPESYRYSYSSTQWDSERWDTRFGIMIGWRF